MYLRNEAQIKTISRGISPMHDCQLIPQVELQLNSCGVNLKKSYHFRMINYYWLKRASEKDPVNIIPLSISEQCLQPDHSFPKQQKHFSFLK